MDLTLILTEDCNLRCTYCYQKEFRATAMPAATGIAAVRKALDEGAESLALTFFGGEPLLQADTLFEILHAARVMEREYGVPVTAKVPTNGLWNQYTSQKLADVIKNNPPVCYPQIPISFGNSYVGIFDAEKAKEATIRLFAAYGIELKKDVPQKGDGYEFVADGYNAKHQIGFKIMVPEGRIGLSGKELPKIADAVKLDAKELAALDKEVTDKKRHIFVVDAQAYPNMDGDLYTPMQYYLASVIDYLNWVHGDREIDRERMLGEPANKKGPREK